MSGEKNHLIVDQVLSLYSMLSMRNLIIPVQQHNIRENLEAVKNAFIDLQFLESFHADKPFLRYLL